VNWAFWFMVLQIVTCAAGGFAFGFGTKSFWLAWVWFSYANANIGFAMLALKG